MDNKDKVHALNVLKKDVIDAYVHIRKTDHTIPDKVLDYMKQCAIDRIEEDLKHYQ